MSIALPFALAIVLQNVQPARVVIEPASDRLSVGETLQMRATAFDAQAQPLQGGASRWFSSDDAVVTVDATGLVTAIRPGEARVTVIINGRPGIATILVPELPPTSLTATVPTDRIMAGTSVPISVRATSQLGDLVVNPIVQFESVRPRIAWADPTGRIYGRAPGTGTIRVRSGTATYDIDIEVVDNTSMSYQIEAPSTTFRSGDVVRFRVVGRGNGGTTLDSLYPAWLVDGRGAQIDPEGSEGVFVAESPGTYRVSALIGETYSASIIVQVVQRHIPAQITTVGRGAAVDHHSGDTWVFEGVDGRDYAYIGTFWYDWMKVWDVTNPGSPMLTDSVQLDARRINDVKIHPNNQVGIVTREGASSRRNGMVILDLKTPAHPTILSEYTETLTGGVHNVWISGPENLVYAVHNGTSEIHIIDIADPTNPTEVGRWGLAKQNKSLHDIIVQEGYAYVSYWDDGVVMLDVGAGSHGGTPRNPQFVSQFKYPIGNTHVAWRAGRYLFIGDEIFPPTWNPDAPIEARGYLHVVDYNDPEHPVEVARYEVPEAGVHNVWVEGDRLYVGYYQAGLRVLDISGELRGDLYRQGRELAVLKTTDAATTTPNWPMTWGAQLFKGHIFTSDLNSGLWVMRLDEEVVIP